MGFLQYLKEKVWSKEALVEASLSRVYQHSKERTIGAITAFRGEYSLAENKKRNKQLAADIRSAGFGYIPIVGTYVENKGQADERKVEEESFLVISEKHDNGKLKGFLKRAGEKYNQDSILYKDGETEEAFLIGTVAGRWPGLGQEFRLGKFTPNRMGDAFTRMKGGRTFTFESVYFRSNVFTLGALKKNGTPEILR